MTASVFEKQLRSMNTMDVSKMDFKQEELFPDFYTATYVSFVKKHKEAYLILTEDQTEYFMESLFLLTIQMVFCIAILNTVNWSKVF